MKYNSAFASVETEGMGETVGFTIAASGKAFRSLIDAIYSRKIEAPIRELATNAFDAHRAAGTIVKFDVHLPTPVAPVFRIRDYGVSMTHDLVMHRYTTLFDSTKDESNDEVGMLGLGSKSAFAYTDSFTLTVWLDGEKRVYSIYIGSDGQPQCSLVARLESDEPRGVCVEFPVKLEDYKQFETAAIRVFKGFPTLPNGLPQSVLNELKKQPFQEGKGWKAFDSAYLEETFYARQGCVLYPIDINHMLDVQDAERLEGVNATIILDFPIGSLQFTNSREFLSYDKNTVAALKQRFTEFQDDLKDELRSMLATCNTGWDRRKLVCSSDLFSYFGRLLPSSLVADEVREINEVLRKGLRYRRSSPSGLFHSIVTCNGNVVYSRLDSEYPDNPHMCGDVAFVYRDKVDGRTPCGPNKRIAKYLQDSGLSFAYTMDWISLKDWERLGRPPIVRLSDLPLPKTTRKITQTRNGDGFQRFKMWRNPQAPTDLSPASKEEVKNCLFAFINRGNIVTAPGQSYYSFRQVWELNRWLTALTGQSIAFINIRSNESPEKFSEYPLFYGCEEKIKSALKKSHIRDAVNVINKSRFSYTVYDRTLSRFLRLNKDLDNPLFGLARFERRAGQIDSRYSHLWGGLVDGSAADLFRDYIIDRALEYGFEVLPEQVSGTSKFPYPLLPPKWERFVMYVSGRRQPDLEFLEDYFSC